MVKLTNILLPVALLSFQVGCTSSDSPQQVLDNALDKNSVALADLSQNDVTYEKVSDGTVHTERYCPAGVLKDTSNNIVGQWTVSGNDLIRGTGPTYKTTNATLEKNVTYSTSGTDRYKVTKISETICL